VATTGGSSSRSSGAGSSIRRSSPTFTCQEPFQSLKTTPAIAGLRVKLQPHAKITYELLTKTLHGESRLDLEKEIAEEERRANDRLALVHEHGGDRGNQHTGGRQGDIIALARNRGTSRSYLVGRLKREAAKAESKDPLFVDPKVAQAAKLLPRVEAGEISAYAAAKEMGWKKSDPYKQLVRWWKLASEEERESFFVYAETWRMTMRSVA
jgi:hypothetical protein